MDSKFHVNNNDIQINRRGDNSILDSEWSDEYIWFIVMSVPVRVLRSFT